MILTLPIATRERVMLRLHEAHAAEGAMPTRIVLGPADHKRLSRDMIRYGFVPSKYLPKPIHVLNVPIVQAEDVEERTIRFEWSE